MNACNLTIRDLHVWYGDVHAVRGVDVDLAAGSVLAIVGESGSGKSTILKAILGLLPERARWEGDIRLDNSSLGRLSSRAMRSLRGKTVGFVPQAPFQAVDPLRRVRSHLQDAALAHGRRLSPAEVADHFRGFGIQEEFCDGDAYPHQWSGGMLQRACAAAALVHGPGLVLADEPTSSLDADARSRVLKLIVDGTRTVVIVTHDLAVAEAVADQVMVLYHGRAMEVGSSDSVIGSPQHPYTRALWSSANRGQGLPIGLSGSPPSLTLADAGCPFAPRCPESIADCVRMPELIDGVRCHLGGTHG